MSLQLNEQVYRSFAKEVKLQNEIAQLKQQLQQLQIDRNQNFPKLFEINATIPNKYGAMMRLNGNLLRLWIRFANFNHHNNFQIQTLKNTLTMKQTQLNLQKAISIKAIAQSSICYHHFFWFNQNPTAIYATAFQNFQISQKNKWQALASEEIPIKPKVNPIMLLSKPTIMQQPFSQFYRHEHTNFGDGINESWLDYLTI